MVFATITTSVVALSACEDNAPGSTGRPYEVVVTARDKEAIDIVAQCLDCYLTSLPQKERAFDVIKADETLYNTTYTQARNVVLVETDNKQYTKTSIRYDNHTGVRNQMIIHLCSPDIKQLKADKKRYETGLRDIINSHEQSITTAFIKAHQNVEAEKNIRRICGVDILVSEALVKEKKGKDFIWITDDDPEQMTNICVYSYPAGNDFIKMRDSIMRVNIPGERKGMYMTTVAKTVKTEAGMTRGLWEMHGDAMGGPFAAKLTADSARHRIVVAEAFIFAPGRNKRNKMRQAEASLNTIKIINNGKQ